MGSLFLTFKSFLATPSFHISIQHPYKKVDIRQNSFISSDKIATFHLRKPKHVILSAYNMLLLDYKKLIFIFVYHFRNSEWLHHLEDPVMCLKMNIFYTLHLIPLIPVTGIAMAVPLRSFIFHLLHDLHGWKNLMAVISLRPLLHLLRRFLIQ